MPTYIERGGEQAFAPPFRQTGTKMQGWLMPADPVAQQKVVDRYLNAPMNGGSGFTYRAMLADILFAIAPIAATRSLTPPNSTYGYTPETDVAFWMLVGRGHTDTSGAWVLDQLLWFLPYVFVDVPTTMATGREVYGYPKELAYLTWPTAGDSLVLGAETMVLPTYAPDTCLVRKPIIEVRKTTSTNVPPPDPLASVDAAIAHLGLRAIRHPDATIDIAGVLTRDLLALEVPMVFLKEFRDVVVPTAACYQVILESPARVDGIPIGWPTFDEVAITVFDYASHPIATELGLGTPVGGSLTVNVPIGLVVWFDFVVELGVVMWPKP